MSRWITRLVPGIAGILLLAGVLIAWLALASLPQTEGEIALPGLAGPVTVERDAHAVPHVVAGSEADAYQAMGFLHGQDRLWQMEFDRLAGEGRLAELLGAAALPHDRFIRTLDLPGSAARAAATLDPDTRGLLEAYARGVNAAIERFGVLLPPEFLLLRHRPEPWRPVDSVRFIKLMALTLSGNWRQELQRAHLARALRPDQMALLWPGLRQAGPVTMAALAELPLGTLAEALPPPPPAGIGSNVWVVSGEHTASGHPLLANDPHLGLQIPGQWYLAHLDMPGLAVIGATLPGLPFVVLGRNAALAWGFTNTGSDTQDLFIERIDPADPDRYLTPGGTKPFARRTETIAVRGAPPERLVVRTSRHGPVVSDLVPGAARLAGTGHVLALAWTQLRDHDQDTTIAAGFAIGRATTPEAFLEAAERYRGAQQNMAFATVSGRIGMISPGLVPIRKQGDGLLPVPGWTGAHDWVGTIPAAALPRRLDPPSGMLINANNRLVDGSYPYFLGAEWEEPFRAERIAALLAGRTGLDRDAFAQIQLDQVSGLVDDLRPHLPRADGLPQELRPTRDALAAWDGAMRPDRPEPLIYAVWRQTVARLLAGRALGADLAELAAARPGFLQRSLAVCDGDACSDATAQAYVSALGELTRRYGADWQAWRWGAAHRAQLAHRPLDGVPVLGELFSRIVPSGGDGTTVNVAGPGPGREGSAFDVVHGPGYRAIYDLGSPDDSWWIAATGQSGHALSSHYGDLVSAWREGAYLPMSMAGEREHGRKVSSLRLIPRAPH